MAENQRITDIETFAERFRLTVRRDECNDQIIPGRRGESQLYFDGEDLCLMVLDGPVALSGSWQDIGGQLWLGDISPNSNGDRVQDVKIQNIPPEKYRVAIRMAKCKQKPDWTPEQKLERAGRLKPSDAPTGKP